MEYKIVRTTEEINDLLNNLAEALEYGSAFPGMSYEEGIQAMFDCLTGVSDDNILA